MPTVTTTRRDEAERRILEAAAELVSRHGLADVSMRAVAAASGLQTPALYRVFQDKNALLRRLTTFTLERYVEAKRDVLSVEDPVGDLHRGWDLHVAFGLDHPELYPLMFGAGPGDPSGAATAADEAHRMLAEVVHRVAARGLLTETPEATTSSVYAATIGATFFLLGLPPDRRDPALVSPLRDSLLHSLVVGGADTAAAVPTLAGGARAVLAHLPHDGNQLGNQLGDQHDDQDTRGPGGLRPVEVALLRDWLTRIARSS
jgi:AcrR family transcriptional regulator